ncbi:MAG: hypothetical protein Q9P01_03180 [Anaerolineae bacterium]|nr:hypothetical protein [Anaerolineae bacterium]
MSVVIITPDLYGAIANGGIGTFCYRFARLLADSGETVTILFVNPSHEKHKNWQQIYKELGIKVILISDYQRDDADWWFVSLSKAVLKVIPTDTEIVYLQDWRATGFILCEHCAFSPKRWSLPV